MSAVLTGRVKWFNNKAGYGFITVTDKTSELVDKDVFVHFSKINVIDSQYKYLVQGEYVQFEIDPNANGEHEYQATNITGINGGSIMCETRRQNRSRMTGDEVVGGGGVGPAPLSRQQSRPFVRKPRPHNHRPASTEHPAVDQDGFIQVVHKRSAPKKTA